MTDEGSEVRRLLAAVVCVFLCFMLGSAPANAAEIPPPPAPRGWTPFPDIRLGQWLPCIEQFDATNDCIAGVAIRRVGESTWKELSFAPDPNFSLDTAKQSWGGGTGAPADFDNYADFAFPAGAWILPDGFVNKVGSKRITVGVSYMANTLHSKIGETYGSDVGELPDDAEVQLRLTSKNVQKYVTWVKANTKDPKVYYPNTQTLIFEATPSLSPWLAIDKKCEAGNSETARSMQNTVVININLTNRSRNEKPSEVVASSNGWWCMGGIQFDKKSGFLVAEVGTSHFDDKGNVIDGWLEAKISGRIAREWWGVDPATAVGYAKVEVTYPDGTTKTATTTARYIKERDWIDLRSYGFTFSTPQLRISMLSPKRVVPKATKVSCVKGKSTKVVTGTKCPAGWKKK